MGLPFGSTAQRLVREMIEKKRERMTRQMSRIQSQVAKHGRIGHQSKREHIQLRDRLEKVPALTANPPPPSVSALSPGIPIRCPCDCPCPCHASALPLCAPSPAPALTRSNAHVHARAHRLPCPCPCLGLHITPTARAWVSHTPPVPTPMQMTPAASGQVSPQCGPTPPHCALCAVHVAANSVRLWGEGSGRIGFSRSKSPFFW